MNNYLLVSSDAYHMSNAFAAAYDVASERLKRKVWPLYERTSFAKTIAPGDRCIIYTAGKKKFGGTIIATTEVKNIEVSKRFDWFELENLQVTSPERVLHLCKTKHFDNPIPLYPLVELLELTNFQNANWGAYMQGGCRKLSEQDFQIIIGA